MNPIGRRNDKADARVFWGTKLGPFSLTDKLPRVINVPTASAYFRTLSMAGDGPAGGHVYLV